MESAAPQSDDEDTVPDWARVVCLVPRSKAARPPQLSDEELVKIRELIVKLEKVLTGCPVASRLQLDP